MKEIVFFILIFSILFIPTVYPQSEYEEVVCPDLTDVGDEPQEGGRYKPAENESGEYFRALFVYVQFSGDTTDYTGWTHDELPDWADEFIDTSVISPYNDLTFSDYWDEMSQGNFDFIGDVYPELVILRPESY